MNVSTSTPAAITNANSRNERSGTIASSANDAASARPATVTAFAAAGVATAIASRRRHPPRLLPDPPGDEDVVVRAERDEQHRRGERDVVREVVVAEDAPGRRASSARGSRAGRGRSTATRYSGATSARMKSASRSEVDERCATTPIALEVVEHARRSCRRRARSRRRSSPATPGPARPRAASARHAGRAGRRKRSTAGAPSGSLVEDDRVAARRRRRAETIIGGAGAGGCSRGPMTAATPGSRSMSCSRRASCAPVGGDPGLLEVDLGRREDPGREALRAAASAARRTSFCLRQRRG